METWIPNPNAKPYIPRRYNNRMSGATWKSWLAPKRCFMSLCKGCLFVILVSTVIINISFILQTNRKLATQTFTQDETPAYDTRDGLPEMVKLQKPDGNLHVQNNRPKTALIQVDTGKTEVVMAVNGKEVLRSEEVEVDRGIHVLVLNQATGAVMAKRVFDTYLFNEDEALVLFLKMISPYRIIVLAIKDEGTFNLRDEARSFLADLGSDQVTKLKWRDMWVFVTIYQSGEALAEKHTKSPDLASWGDHISLSVNVTLRDDYGCEKWGKDAVSQRRRKFCNEVEGYGDVCSCDKPSPIDFPNVPLESGEYLDIPITVIASNRPHYLFRMLKTLLQTPGVMVDKIMVFIDGFFDEPLGVTRLLNLKGIQHAPHGLKNARIAQHYKASITATFQKFPESDYVIIIEEDLDVSPDFFNYFKQTMPLLEDPTLYCISAWNDQGYDHSCKDPTLLYRIETMPGLGWMMKKSLFIQELDPQWPSVDKQWDWDMWMRHNMIRKSRECIIPDISRTYHFGSKGLNMNPYFQELYFVRHKLQTEPNIQLKDVEKMKSEPYEVLINDLIKGAKVLNHSMDPCKDGFIPKTKDETYVMFIQMKTETDFETWKTLAKCYKLWDLDVRGFHKSMWRQFHEDKHLIIVGVPASPYAKYKPESVTPIFLPEKKDDKAR